MTELAQVIPISPPGPSPTTRRLELIDALYQLALAGSSEVELAATALDPYDTYRLALIFAKVDDANGAVS
jgi:hypothetical protein